MAMFESLGEVILSLIAPEATVAASLFAGQITYAKKNKQKFRVMQKFIVRLADIHILTETDFGMRLSKVLT